MDSPVTTIEHVNVDEQHGYCLNQQGKAGNINLFRVERVGGDLHRSIASAYQVLGGRQMVTLGDAVSSGRPQGFPKITVLVCSLNEAENLPAVLPAIPQWVDQVLLVDGMSTDGTVGIARSLRPDLQVLYEPKRGKDVALRLGIQHAIGEIVVALDSDGEASPRDIPRFVDLLLNGYDFVKGSRFALGWKNKPFPRIVGNWLIATVCNLIYRTQFTDLCSGYNAFWKRKTQDAGLWSCDGWNYEPRIVARALMAGLKVVEFHQNYEGRISGESKLPDWWQGINALWYLVMERFRSSPRQLRRP
jgi:glycosyltransferase involved in cell wall biosynthesis